MSYNFTFTDDLGAIFKQIETERGKQDREHGGPDHDDLHHYNDWTAILVRHLGLAAGDEAEVDEARWRKQMIRIAALACAAVESHDRREERKRTAGHHKEGSGF